MARACTIIGGILSVLGVAAALFFVIVMTRDEAYRQAELVASRNPGNAMYEAEFGAARIRRGFEVVGVGGGILLALNGMTLLALGIVASQRLEQR